MSKLRLLLLFSLHFSMGIMAQQVMKPKEKSNIYIVPSFTNFKLNWGNYSFNDVKVMEPGISVLQSNAIEFAGADLKTSGYWNQYVDNNLIVLIEPANHPKLMYRGQFTYSKLQSTLYSRSLVNSYPSDTLYYSSKIIFMDSTVNQNIDYSISFNRVGLGFSVLRELKTIGIFQVYSGISVNAGLFTNVKANFSYTVSSGIFPSTMIGSSHMLDNTSYLNESRNLKNGYFATASLPLGLRIITNSKFSLLNRVQINLEMQPFIGYNKISDLGKGKMNGGINQSIGFIFKLN